MDYKWYALFVMQGKEFYVKDKLELICTELDNIDRVLLPTIKEISEVRRKKIVRNIPVYPSYLFIHAYLGRGLQTIISEVNYVVRLLGRTKPFAIPDKEMDIVQAIASDNKIHSAFSYKIGDVVEILGGHCKGLSGRVIDIIDTNNLKLEIQIFNRAIYTTIKLEDAKAG